MSHITRPALTKLRKGDTVQFTGCGASGWQMGEFDALTEKGARFINCVPLYPIGRECKVGEEKTYEGQPQQIWVYTADEERPLIWDSKAMTLQELAG